MSENINLQNEEENVIVATFNIATENTTITLKNLTDMTQIDWGDGIIDSELTHTYSQIGEYTCKIYNITSIGSSAFRNCSSLTSVEIGDSVTSIGNYAFYGCSRLTEIVIPDSVTSISTSAFQSCSSLTSVVIGDGVTNVGALAFSYCYGLTSVVIPSSVTRIGDYAFYDCSSLTSVTFKGKEAIPVEMLTDSYINNSTPTYYVPKDSIEAYRNAWSGTVAEEKIQPDPDEFLINLDGLKIYHENLKEKYLNSIATQNWVQEQLVGKTDYLGVVDTIPNFPNAEAGDYCRVQTEFVYDTATGETAHIGDVLIAVKDNPTQSIADWDLLHNELASATLVTVGGVAQTSWDADTKVGFDHITSPTRAGLMMVGEGLIASSSGNGKVNIRKAEKSDIDAKTQNYKPITPVLSEYTTMKCLTDIKDTTLWTDDTTDEEGNVVKGTKTKACETIGAVAQVSLSDADMADGGVRGRVYVIDHTNTQTTKKLAIQSYTDSIPLRDGQGNLYVGDPVQQLHCVNKRYAEANFVAKPTTTSGYNRAYCADASGATLMQSLMYPNYSYDESGAPSRVGIPVMDKGNIGCALPTADYHTANKKYVDDLVGNINTVLEAIMGV